MTIIEKFAFVLSTGIYNFFGFANEPLDCLTKILLFKNIYYMIISVIIIFIKIFFIK
jgi:hypothetical protein